MYTHSFLIRCLLTNGQLTHPDLDLDHKFYREPTMDTNPNPSSPAKNELIETMFKSLNAYTSELQKGSFFDEV